MCYRLGWSKLQYLCRWVLPSVERDVFALLCKLLNMHKRYVSMLELLPGLLLVFDHVLSFRNN